MTLRAVRVCVGLAVASALMATGCSDPAETPERVIENGTVPERAEGAAADVQRMAPALESHFRDAGYALTLEEAIDALAEADLEPTEPNVVGGYRYDDATVEFVLCIETPDGAYASYDTRPMALLQTGASGGCPAD